MSEGPASAAAKAAPAAPSDAWRRKSTTSYAVLSFFIFAVVVGVHWTTVSRENAELPLERVIAALQGSCMVPADVAAAALTSAALPPAFFGLAVWVDAAALLPGVHSTLALLQERLPGEAAAAASMTATAVPLPSHALFSFVRQQSAMRDEAVDGLVREAASSAHHTSPAHVRRTLEHLASQQQLGLPALKHAFLPEVGQEAELHAVSLFSVPASVLPQEAASRVQCFVADARQAYCVLPVEEPSANNTAVEEEAVDAHGLAAAAAAAEPRYAAASLTPSSYRLRAASLEAEVRAALLSVMAKQLGLPSFKAADLSAWRRAREQRGCLYAIASLRSTQRSIAAHTNMVVPHSTEHMLAALEHHIHTGSFLRAARAADDLQFHPSLTPQLYIPWDHSVVSQLVVLLPMLSCTLLAIRFVVEERRADRARAKAAASAASPDEKKNQ